jgi:hypothetical protein
MFCGECGTQNPDTNQFCKNCGKPLRKSQQVRPPPQPAAAPPAPAAVPPVQPVSWPPRQPAVMQPPVVPAGMAAPVKPPLNRVVLALGIAGVVVGIASWFRYPYILAVLAMILGAIAIAKSEKKTGAVAIIGGIALLIGLACIVVDLFYFTIFPAPVLDL